MEDPVQLKEEGNKFFQGNDYENAIKSYSKALKLAKDPSLQAVLYRNRAACFLKKEKYAQVTTDATKAIDINPSDIKALYRRSQALEKLGKLDQAFKDVQRCATIEPRNQSFQDALRRLGTTIQEKAANNLIVLGREEAGAERIFQNNGLNLLLRLIETKNPELILAATRTLSGMCTRHMARATAILHMLGINKICLWMSIDHEEISLAVSNLLQAIIDSLTGEGKKEEHGKEDALVLDTKKDIKAIIAHLLDMLPSKKISGHGRDRALNLLNKNVPRQDLKIHDNSRTIFVIDNGLKKILKVAGQIPEMSDCLPLTDNTQLTASVLLNKLYDDLRCDPERENFRLICEEYIKSKIDPKDMDKTLHAIQTVSGVLQGPFDLGNKLLSMNGVMEMMVALCGSEREIDQLIAGLCKLGSAGGTDYGLRQFAEGSTEKLAKQCRKWLCNPTIDTRTRKWAVEGLAYLTLDADVKDDFVQDEPAMQAMFELAKTSDKTILYSVASVLVNCTNSYDVKELVPELDKKDFITKRVKRLIKAGVTSALVCMDANDRGIIVAQGGGKALIPLALEGTDVGKIKASHALAKIAAISNPDIAFPGERRDGLQNYEALLGLTNFSGRSDKLRQKIIKEKALPDIENYMFENHEQLRQAATECMCNLVVNKEVQDRFIAEGNDRLKLIVLLCGEDDDKVQNAAAGALAMLTAAHKTLCHKLTQVTTQWLEILQRLCLHEKQEVQHRGVVIVYNLIHADQELAKKLVESEMLEILTVIGKEVDDAKRQHIINVARECLVKFMDYGLIKPLTQP
ncbi:hypothetical protein E2320_018228 [Naja naja]|nr:hypothetical protein E2320_018228 [Naja naja]